MLRLFHHGKTGALPCLSHAQPRRQTPTCLCAEGWTLSRLINMPGHAAFYRSMNSRSDIFMRVCRFHHAITVINSTFNDFLTTEARTAVGNTSLKLVGKKGCMNACAAE